MAIANYWKLNESSGTTVSDSIGGLNLTAVGTTIQDGISGKARFLNGTTDFIQSGGVNALGTNFEFQIFFLAAASNINKILFGTEADGTNQGACRLVTDGSGNLTLFLGNLFGNLNVTLNTGIAPKLNKFQMLSFKLSSSVQECFIDGVSIGTIGNGNSYPNSALPHIGYAATNSAVGKYDEFKKYNSALSSGERKNQFSFMKGFI